MLSLARAGLGLVAKQALQKPTIGLVRAAVLNNGLQQQQNDTLTNKIQIRTRYYPANPGVACPKEGIEETFEEFDARYEGLLNNPKIDEWEIRKHMNDLCGFDMVPEPKIVIAALKACRRVNDHSLAVRFIEAVFAKAHFSKEVLEYIKAEITPTCQELGISFPEELGYDKPELALGDPERCSFIEQADHTQK